MAATWYIRLNETHYDFFDKLAKKAGDLEQGGASRQCRKFLNEKIEEAREKVGDE